MTTTTGARIPRGLQDGAASPAPPTSAKAPRAPKGLGADGRRLWRALTEAYDFEVHELYLLTQACRAVDRLQDIAEGLVDAPLTVRNSRGDEVAHPLLAEQRMQAQGLTKLLASMRLPTGETADGALIRPQRRGGARGAYGIRGAVAGGVS